MIRLLEGLTPAYLKPLLKLEINTERKVEPRLKQLT